MLRRTIALVLAGLIVAAGIYGAVNRRTYRDITSEPDYLDNFYVGELLGELAPGVCQSMRDNLPSSNIIIRVSPLSGLEHSFMTSRQKFVVNEVFKGDGIAAGVEIYLTSMGWFASPREEEWSEINEIERDYVNIPIQGKQYLAFVEGTIDLHNDDPIPTYHLVDYYSFSKLIFAPIFCYESIPNVISENFYRTSTYVPYNDVKDNEFFASTPEALRQMETLKQEFISMYPAGSGR